MHPTGIEVALESATIDLIVRDFSEQGLKQKEALLESIVQDVMKAFPGAEILGVRALVSQPTPAPTAGTTTEDDDD